MARDVNLYWPHAPWKTEARKTRKRLARWQDALAKSTKALVISHGGCMDGIASAVITQRALGGGVGVAYAQPNQVPEALEFVGDHSAGGRSLYVADLSLQKPDLARIVAACERLHAQGWRIEWRDHHHKQWEGLDLAPLKAHLAVLEVNTDATESGASLQQQALAPGDDALKRLAAVVRDRDLWWNKDPQSEVLEFALGHLGPGAFARELMAIDDVVVTPKLQAASEAEREAQKAAKAKLLGRTAYFGQEDSKVGIVYGWLPRNTGLHDLIEQQGCAVAINIRPNGKISLRSRKDKPVCHLIAQEFGG